MSGLCLYWLLSESPVLNKPFFGIKSLPSGNIIAWSFFILYSWTILAVFRILLFPRKKGKGIKVLNYLLKIALIGSILWGFVSFLLSGNWQFSFDNSVVFFNIWLGYSMIVAFLPLLGLMVLIMYYIRSSRGE